MPHPDQKEHAAGQMCVDLGVRPSSHTPNLTGDFLVRLHTAIDIMRRLVMALIEQES